MSFKKKPVAVALCCCLLFLGVGASVSAATSVACVGNSITAGYGLSDTTKRYPAVLLKQLNTTYLTQAITNLTSTVTLWNAGVSARTMLKHGNLPIWNETVFKQIFTLLRVLLR